MSLWPHQQRALDELEQAIKAGERNICITSPTGGGKSRMMFTHMNYASGDIALYTDRRMLLSQLSDGLTEQGLVHGIRAAGEEPRLLESIQLCMVQTEASRCLNGNRPVHPADYVVIDEAHKNAGDSMLQLVEKHRAANDHGVAVIGYTATPLGIGHLYSKLIIAGTNSELRACGAHVPAKHYGPDEPDTKWIGKIAIGEGECGLPQRKRMQFATRVFGRVVDHYRIYNPDMRPAILFAPGVKESIWFAEHLSANGISAAHIDGECVWLDGEQHPTTDDLRAEIMERSRDGDIKVICNRFVLREGIDAPWLYHGIFATVFGSLTSYIQAGGRLLRSHPSMDHVVIQDHGGNWHRHGSLNVDREWDLIYTDRIAAGIREKRIRDKEDPEPITCPTCHAIRLSGPVCHECGYKATKKTRPVMQADGSLRDVPGDIIKARRVAERTDERLEKSWNSRIRACRNSKKEHVRNSTLAQIAARFARDNNWKYPSPEWKGMPVQDADWFRPVVEVALRGEQRQVDPKEYAEAPF